VDWPEQAPQPEQSFKNCSGTPAVETPARGSQVGVQGTPKVDTLGTIHASLLDGGGAETLDAIPSSAPVSFLVRRNGGAGGRAMRQAITIARLFTCHYTSCGSITGSQPTNGAGQATATYTSSTTSGFCSVTATESGTGQSATTQVDQTSV
jgi:hypothetical protein